jgi:hypothetical protein
VGEAVQITGSGGPDKGPGLNYVAYVSGPEVRKGAQSTNMLHMFLVWRSGGCIRFWSEGPERGSGPNYVSYFWSVGPAEDPGPNYIAYVFSPKRPRGPNMLHMFLSLSVVSLFVYFTNEPF